MAETWSTVRDWPVAGAYGIACTQPFTCYYAARRRPRPRHEQRWTHCTSNPPSETAAPRFAAIYSVVEEDRFGGAEAEVRRRLPLSSCGL